MKRFLLSALALLSVMSARALDYEPDPGFSGQLTVGMNVSQIRGMVYDMNLLAPGWVDPRAKVGVSVGLNGRIMLPEAHGTYLLFGVEWSQRGGKYTRSVEWKNNNMTYSSTHKLDLHYVNIPVHVGYHYNFNRDWGMFGEFGPYFAVGVCGKNSISTETDGREATAMENALTFAAFKKRASGEGLGGLQRFDCGLGMRVGCEYKGIYSLNVGFDWGLTDMLRDEYRDDFFDSNNKSCGKIRNFNMSLTLGYRF